MVTRLFWLTVAVLLSPASTEFHCACSHSPNKNVLAHPENSATVIGHLIDSDCRKLADNSSVNQNYYAIEFHHQVGYLADENDLEVKTCQGDPSATDLIFHTVNTSGSPLRFIGIGYDLLHGNTGGLDRTIDGDDPGMHLAKRIFQLTTTGGHDNGTAREVEVTPNTPCIHSNEASIISSGKRYQDELLRRIVFPQDYPENISWAAFTLNREFREVQQKTEAYESTIYRDVMNSCYLGTFRYQDEWANASDFSVTTSFAKDVCNLPEVYNSVEYSKFVDNWGTSIIMAAKIGTLSTARYKTNDKQLVERIQELNQTEAVLLPGGNFKGYRSSVNVNLTVFDSLGYTAPFGRWVSSAAVGTRSNPAVIEMMLYSLTEALNPKYWTKVIQSNSCRGLDAPRLTRLAENLRLALNHYADYRANKENLQNIQPLTDHPLQMPLTWPSGTYTLMQAAQGCPLGNENQVLWKAGYRSYETEAGNQFSKYIQAYLAGSFSSSDIQTKFCTKTQVSVELEYDREWPKGTYCILKHGSCPANFAEGYIIWDDDDGGNFSSNHNRYGGVMPDGSYNKDTQINYCCRNDSPNSLTILMPREKPFVLVRYGSKCPVVHGMHLDVVFVRWDDEDDNNHDSAGGLHPSDFGGPKDHLLYFCYYRYRVNIPENVIIG